MTDHYAEAERLLAHEYRSDEGARTGYMAAQLHAMLAAAEGQRALLALMEQAIAAASPKPADPEPPAALSIPWPPDEATVERVARTLHNLGHPDGCHCGAIGWEAWASDASAVLDALGATDVAVPIGAALGAEMAEHSRADVRVVR